MLWYIYYIDTKEPSKPYPILAMLNDPDLEESKSNGDGIASPLQLGVSCRTPSGTPVRAPFRVSLKQPIKEPLKNP